jgi:proline dehydrogenase
MTVLGGVEEIAVRRWIAGRKLEDAVAAVKELNAKGMDGIINHLGEKVVYRAHARAAVKASMDIIDAIKLNKLGADIAVKLTDLGLNMDVAFCSKNYNDVARYAKSKGVFVWIDMEECGFVDDTIKIYSSMVKSGNVGICIQSYLKRSIDDVRKLDRKAVIRLVKGAYADRAGGFQTRREATGNYVLLMDYIFRNFGRFTIATHDSSLIDIALKMNRKYRRDVTYAMLRGVRSNYALELARKGEKVAVYVPFGEDILGYAYRRLKELSNLKLIARSILGGR